MKIGLRPIAAVCLTLLFSSGCAQPLYHWGGYEDSLYTRYNDRSEAGQAEAFKLLEETIKGAEESNAKVPPGVFAEYGYLLFQQGDLDGSLSALQKEAELYPESQHLMQSLISRIQERQKS